MRATRTRRRPSCARSRPFTISLVATTDRREEEDAIPESIVIGEAPGRLDVLGGVADYSGALVLETPIDRVTRVALKARAEKRLRFVSEEEGEEAAVTLDVLADCRGLSCEQRRSVLDAYGVPAFVRYPLGCLLVLGDATGISLDTGLDFDIRSTVPRSMGVSSSAALEVATLRALAKHFAIDLDGAELARLGQRAENEIVGAPCGLMDQLTSACGEPGALLPILCRPDHLEPTVRLPKDIIVVGWPSGVRHDVGASPYATARAATFMGFEILRRAIGGDWRHPSEIKPSLFLRHADAVPRTITGQEYASRYGEIPDGLSRLEPTRLYSVRDCLSFPIHEHARARLAVDLLRAGVLDELVLRHLGESMFQSHAGYSSIGLGCEEADRMVDLVDSLGVERGFFGARASGGGSGGTVVVLMRRDAVETLDRARRTLGEPAATTPILFSARAAR